MALPAPVPPSPPRSRPRLRGVTHGYAFFLFLVLGVPLVLAASSVLETVAAAVFAGTVVAMFGASALYNCVTWTPKRRLWMQRLDHSMIYLLIAGTYTPFGLLVLSGAWRIVVLAVVWTGVAAAISIAFLRPRAPKWVPAVIAVALGWVGVVAFPRLLDGVGGAGVVLLLAGGVLYTVGAIVYARRRPDPVPAVFGYHELFHAFVVAAVACQYASVAFFVL